MMQHAPMTTAISIASAALAALYIQILSAVVILVVLPHRWSARSRSTTRSA